MHLNLISLFTFYLSAMFLLSTMRRWQVYQDIAQLVVRSPNRWPGVLRQVRHHGAIFATKTIFRPLAVAFSLTLFQMICSRLIYPKAKITLAEVGEIWWMLPFLGVSFFAMLGIDGYGIVRVSKIDRRETEKYLDEAEHWLTSWKTPLIRTVTFGYVNPLRIVDVEVRKALDAGSKLVQFTLWWMALQVGLRLTFGLILWTTWAIWSHRVPMPVAELP